MTRTFRITVNVTLCGDNNDLDKMEKELAQNLDFCVDRGYLFDSVNNVEVEQWAGEVEELQDEQS